MPRNGLTIVLTKAAMLKMRRTFTAAIAAEDPKTAAALKRVQQSLEEMYRELRLPPGYKFRRAGVSGRRLC